jgi:putative inorganic carbon (hco3(-)) transporter
LICIYLFLEYFRPQTLYPSIDVIPLAKTVLLLTMALFVIRANFNIVKNGINKLLLLFFVIILLSSVNAMSFEAAIGKVPEFIAWMIIYFLIVNIVNTEKRFLVFMLSFLLYSFKMAQFSFRGWASQGFTFAASGTGGGPGWFQNSGEFGIQMCIFLPLGFYFFLGLKEYWPLWKKGFFILFPIFAVTGTISSSSRGALLGACVVMLWILIKSRQRWKGLFVLIGVGIWVFSLVPPEQKERFERARHMDDRTSQTRVERWKKGMEMAAKNPLLGVGYGNWVVADRAMFDGDGSFSHNIFIECMSELGYSGLVVFLLMVSYTFVNNYQTRKFSSAPGAENRFIYYMAHGLDGALVGYLISGFFVTVFYYPYFWINLAMSVSLNNISKK